MSGHDDWPSHSQHDDFSRSFDDQTTRWEPTSAGADMLNFNPANFYDISTPIGAMNHAREQDRFQQEMFDRPPTGEMRIGQIPALLAIGAVILLVWFF